MQLTKAVGWVERSETHPTIRLKSNQPNREDTSWGFVTASRGRQGEHAPPRAFIDAWGIGQIQDGIDAGPEFHALVFRWQEARTPQS